MATQQTDFSLKAKVKTENVIKDFCIYNASNQFLKMIIIYENDYNLYQLKLHDINIISKDFNFKKINVNYHIIFNNILNKHLSMSYLYKPFAIVFFIDFFGYLRLEGVLRGFGNDISCN